MPSLAQKGAVWTIFFLAVPAVVMYLVDLVRSHHVAGNLGWLACALAFAGLGIRIFQCGVRIDSDKVIVRNLFSTRRIPLTAITGVEPRTGWGANTQHGQGRRVFLIVGDQRFKVDALNSPNAMVRKDNAERLRQFLHP